MALHRPHPHLHIGEGTESLPFLGAGWDSSLPQSSLARLCLGIKADNCDSLHCCVMRVASAGQHHSHGSYRPQLRESQGGMKHVVFWDRDGMSVRSKQGTWVSVGLQAVFLTLLSEIESVDGT